MSSVSDPPDSSRQENMDANDKPLRQEQAASFSNAGGKEDIEPQHLKNGHQDTSVTPLAVSLTVMCMICCIFWRWLHLCACGHCCAIESPQRAQSLQER